ncbi:MAG: hypothetical protein M1511_09230 [Deltaproteobacteria bacterium]|nr:hypothetical protein [Deltaproteobacteria bacterium]
MSQFSGSDEFELNVHKCFHRIFELLMKIDEVVRKEAESEEHSGDCGVMCGMRDWVEEVILHCHLAWQYHRLSKGPITLDTWEQIEHPGTEEES